MRPLNISKFKKGLILGLIVGVVLTIGGQYAHKFWLSYKYRYDTKLFFIGTKIVEDDLPDSKVLDISLTPESHANVNYVYDELYDVHVTYERNKHIKKITFPVGFTKGVAIKPKTSEIVVLDDQAKPIYTLQGDK